MQKLGPQVFLGVTAKGHGMIFCASNRYSLHAFGISTQLGSPPLPQLEMAL